MPKIPLKWLSDKFDAALWTYKYQSFGENASDVYDWTKFIYKIDQSGMIIRRCIILCSVDATCEYFVFVDNICYFGSFDYDGEVISTNNISEVTNVYLKMAENDNDYYDYYDSSSFSHSRLGK